MNNSIKNIRSEPIDKNRIKDEQLISIISIKSLYERSTVDHHIAGYPCATLFQ